MALMQLLLSLSTMNFAALFVGKFLMGTLTIVAFEVAILRNRVQYPERRSMLRSIGEHSIDDSVLSSMTLFADQKSSSQQIKFSKREEILHLLEVIAMERTFQQKGGVNKFPLYSSQKSQDDLSTNKPQMNGIGLSGVQQLDIVAVDHEPIRCVTEYHKPETSALLSGWLEVKAAGLRGKGLFALCSIEENVFIGEYVGEKLTYRQYLSRYPKGDSEYTFLVSDEMQRRDRTYVDAADESKSNLLRFVNHDSLNPNVKVEVIFLGPKDRDARKYEKVIVETAKKEEAHQDDKNNGDQDDLSSQIKNEVRAGLSTTGVERNSTQTGKDMKSSKGDRFEKPVLKRRGANFEIRMTSLTFIPAGRELFFDYGSMYKPAAAWSAD